MKITSILVFVILVSVQNCENLKTGDEMILHGKESCCEIVSPRVCWKYQDTWTCTHYRYNYCGDFCTSKRFYLRVQKSRLMSNESIMLVEPKLEADSSLICLSRNCSKIDCLGCIDDVNSARCDHQCSAYPCHKQCQFIDFDYFCTTTGGAACELSQNS